MTQEQTVCLMIDGMKCGGCVASVEQAINKVDGVVNAQVSLEKNQAIVNGAVSVDKLMEAIKAAGFTASES